MALDTIPKTGPARSGEIRSLELIRDLAVMVAALSTRVDRLEQARDATADKQPRGEGHV